MKLKNVEFAITPWEQFKGLMLRKKFEGYLIFVLKKESRWKASIHMLFMRFPIDIVWLDKHKKVVDTKLNAKPWGINHTPKKPAKYVVESRVGKKKWRIGEKIEF